MQHRGALDTFVIGFQPDGMHRLFSIPMHEVTDLDLEAHAVLGAQSAFLLAVGDWIRVTSSERFVPFSRELCFRRLGHAF